MYRFLFGLLCFAAAALAGAEFSLDVNPERLAVKTGGDIYVINPHPVPVNNAWVLERNGDSGQRLWVEVLTSSPIPESRLRGPFRIMPSLGDSEVNILENSSERIVIRVEYWLSAFGDEHGRGISRRIFAFGRLFAEFRFDRNVSRAGIMLALRCHGRAPFIVDEYSVSFGEKPGKSVLFPSDRKFPVELKMGETLPLELKIGSKDLPPTGRPGLNSEPVILP